MKRVKLTKVHIVLLIFLLLILGLGRVLIGPSPKGEAPLGRWRHLAIETATLYRTDTGRTEFTFEDMRDDGYVLVADCFGNLPNWRFKIINNSSYQLIDQRRDYLISYGGLFDTGEKEGILRMNLELASYYGHCLAFDGLVTQGSGNPIFFDDTIFKGARTTRTILSSVLPTIITMADGTKIRGYYFRKYRTTGRKLRENGYRQEIIYGSIK